LSKTDSDRTPNATPVRMRPMEERAESTRGRLAERSQFGETRTVRGDAPVSQIWDGWRVCGGRVGIGLNDLSKRSQFSTIPERKCNSSMVMRTAYDDAERSQFECVCRGAGAHVAGRYAVPVGKGSSRLAPTFIVERGLVTNSGRYLKGLEIIVVTGYSGGEIRDDVLLPRDWRG
jgi:hypothetical protein